jgi:hypothetical protein
MDVKHPGVSQGHDDRHDLDTHGVDLRRLGCHRFRHFAL